MATAIEGRRSALRAIAKPKVEDYLAHCGRQTLDLVASFQRALVNDLVVRTLAAAREYEVATLFVTGGVAANQELRNTFESTAAKRRVGCFLSFTSTFYRQCRHDCRRSLSQVSCEGLGAAGIFR